MLSATSSCRAILLGTATGVRSMIPVAVVSWAVSSGHLRVPADSPLALLQRPRVKNALFLCAALEVLLDKLPVTPPRTSLGPLSMRVASGALVGACSVEPEGESPVLGAAMGSAAAVWGAFAGLGARTQITGHGVPELLTAAVDDALAAVLALPPVLQRGRG